MSLDSVKMAHVHRVLKLCGGSRVRAAEMLGVETTTLWRWLGGSNRTKPAEKPFRGKNGSFQRKK